MRTRVIRPKAGKVITDKQLKVDKNTKIFNLTLGFQTKDRNHHTRN